MIGHLDLDAFFAAVELHRHPKLRGRPVVVGGDPDTRGVVATASYAARRFGIRSAMSCAEARRRCPEVVFIRPDIAHYREWSDRVWTAVAACCDQVEQVGLDEGYVVLDGDGVEHGRAVLQALRDSVRLSASMGVAATKVVAKIASDRDKPGGLTIVPAGREAAFLAPLPLRLLPGVGPRTAERLATLGIALIGQLAAASDEALDAAVPGRTGRLLRDRAAGIDPRPVEVVPAARISISMEVTFDRDVRDPNELITRLRGWAAELAAQLVASGRGARTVTIKLRYADFATISRAQTLAAPTHDAETIAAIGEGAVRRALRERSGPIRLVGLGVAGLCRHAQMTLFSHDSVAPDLYERAEEVYAARID